MGATQTQTETVISGSFETSEVANGLVGPLDAVMSSNVNHIVINFDKENNSIKVNAMNDDKAIIAFVEYLDGVTSKININEDYELGIYELNEFVSMSKIFSEGFDFSISKNTVRIENDGQEYLFLCSDPDAIKQGPKVLKANLEWLAEFEWSKEAYSSFYQAIGKLTQDYVIISGKEGEKNLSLKIADTEIASSAFTATVDLEEANSKDFTVVIKKDYFRPIVNSYTENLNIQISTKLVSFDTKNEYNKVRYYVSAEAKNG